MALGRLEVTSSDHVVLRFDLAGVGNRGLAALVDATVAAVLVSGWLIFMQFPAVPLLMSISLLGAPLVGWSYFILLEWLWNGQTLGKRMAGLRVINEDGSPARFMAVFVRNLLRVVDFLPFAYGAGTLAILFTPRSQRLGDLAAGTYVVRAPRPRTDWLALRTRVPDAVAPASAPAGEAGALPASLAPQLHVGALSGDAQRLVREFVVREARLPAAERAAVARSIAKHLRERIPEAQESDDLALIHSVARSLRASGDH